MEGITVGQALEVFAFETKRCQNRDRKALLRLLHSALEEVRRLGAYGFLREWCVCIDRPCFTLPKDCQSLVAYKYNQVNRGDVKSPVYSYTSNSVQIRHSDLKHLLGQTSEHSHFSGGGGGYGFYEDYSAFCPNDGEIILNANHSVTEYPFPKKPGYLHFVSSSEEDCGLKVEVAGCYKGKRVVPDDTYCECLSIGSRGEAPQWSCYLYDELSSIKLPDTCGFVSLIYKSECGGDKQVLSTYDPLECVPRYRMIHAASLDFCCNYQICLLGYVNVRSLTRDCDMIPVESVDLLTEMARRQKAKDDGDRELAEFIYQEMLRMVNDDMAIMEGHDGDFNLALEGSFATMDRIEN